MKNRRKAVFEASTNRESSQFELIEMETAILQNETMDSTIQRVIQRADSASGRGRGRRGRGSQSGREIRGGTIRGRRGRSAVASINQVS